MKKDYFPQWYIDKFEQREIKYYKSFNLILIITVFIFSAITLKNLSTFNNFTNETKNTVEENNAEINNYISVESFFNIKDSILNSSLNTDTILINEKIISMSIRLQNTSEYLESIKYLENYGDIIYISNIIETDKGRYFEVKVKIKDEKY
jgi:hypothetical protein